MKNKYNQRWLFVGVSHFTKKFRIPGIKISKLKNILKFRDFWEFRFLGFRDFGLRIFFSNPDPLDFSNIPNSEAISAYI